MVAVARAGLTVAQQRVLLVILRSLLAGDPRWEEFHDDMFRLANRRLVEDSDDAVGKGLLRAVTALEVNVFGPGSVLGIDDSP